MRALARRAGRLLAYAWLALLHIGLVAAFATDVIDSETWWQAWRQLLARSLTLPISWGLPMMLGVGLWFLCKEPEDE